MKRLLFVAMLSIAPVWAGANKEGMPLAGIPGFVPPFGFCVAVKGVSFTSCSAQPNVDKQDAQFFRDYTLALLDFMSTNRESPFVVPSGIIFPELGDARDPKAPGYCVCAADSQSVDTTGSPYEKPTNSGKGGCTYWMVCYIKGVPAPK
jgi:hypothetical protein